MTTISFKVSQNHNAPKTYFVKVPSSFFKMSPCKQNIYLLKAIKVKARPLDPLARVA